MRRSTGNLPEDEPVLQKGVCRGLDHHSPVEHATRHRGKLGKCFEKLNKISKYIYIYDLDIKAAATEKLKPLRIVMHEA